MTGRQVNIYLQEKTYNAVRQLVGPRQISRYINQAVEERLAYEQKSADEELRRQLIAGYKANAKNEKLQTELGL
jgi:CRISPR/Cas system Type II protein with McrA/HNH and RuvC-like nuclease domain